jgi:sugar (pentulose or hexulose) kinase
MKAKQPVIAVFDIGKTNKKLLVFDESYQVVMEESTSFAEVTDEDGYPCEDVDVLVAWIVRHVQSLAKSPSFDLKAVNFSTYGASLLYIDERGQRLSSLYNYLKPYPAGLLDKFYSRHGDKETVSAETSSPIMGHLNAGLQLYWFKEERPDLYRKLHAVLHFPQYLSYQLTGKTFAEMTNVGCHSAMWNFQVSAYHQWLSEEGIADKLLPVINGNHAIRIKNDNGNEIAVGVGLHDSSAAIIPYLCTFTEPFVIVSTGTWTISLNPFNKELPNAVDLSNGCLSYLTYKGDPVRISMLFAGHDHDQQAARIASHFNMSPDYFKSFAYEPRWVEAIQKASEDDNLFHSDQHYDSPTDPCVFHLRHLTQFQTAEHAYHQLVVDIIRRQVSATRLTINSGIKHLYVDGGFCKNPIYMQLLTDAFPEMNVYATSMIQGTALGAALAMHEHWNKSELPATLINLKHYPKSADLVNTVSNS